MMNFNFNQRKSLSQNDKISQAKSSQKMETLTQEINDYDRFELLSAYLDGETTPLERKKVQEWLDTDPQAQQLYHRLLKLRQGMLSLQVPVSTISPEVMAQRVIAKAHKRTLKRRLVWGGGAIAAMVVGTVSLILGGNSSLMPRMAEAPEGKSAEEKETLTIAINQPILEIPVSSDNLMIPVDRPLLEIPQNNESSSNEEIN